MHAVRARLLLPGNAITGTNASNFESVVKYWQTASTVLDQFTAEAKVGPFCQRDQAGVSQHQRRLDPCRPGQLTASRLRRGIFVLTIKINDVDPRLS